MRVTHKRYTLQEYISYRNMILSKAKRRTEVFGDKGYNYYWIRLKLIDEQYPEFHKFGIIQLK